MRIDMEMKMLIKGGLFCAFGIWYQMLLLVAIFHGAVGFWFAKAPKRPFCEIRADSSCLIIDFLVLKMS